MVFRILVSELWNCAVFFSLRPDTTEAWLEAKEFWKGQDTGFQTGQSSFQFLLFSSFHTDTTVQHKTEKILVKKVIKNTWNTPGSEFIVCFVTFFEF